MLNWHVLSIYREVLIVFVGEREFSAVDEISVMAERYESAHMRSTTWSGNTQPGNGQHRGITEMPPQMPRGGKVSHCVTAATESAMSLITVESIVRPR